MSKPGFKDVDFGASPKHQMHTPPDSPEKTTYPKDFPIHPKKTDGLAGVGGGHARKETLAHRRNTSLGSLEHNLTIPTSPSSHNTIEVPALRSPDADTTQFMHHLSSTPSTRERRVSRNSFGASLPIPKSKRQSRLSSVTYPAEVQEALKAGVKPSLAQPSRDILTSQVQDVLAHKVEAAKNMAFVFDIDGVLVHGDRPISEGSRCWPCSTATTSSASRSRTSS